MICCSLMSFILFVLMTNILAHLGRETELTNGCIIGTMCHVTSQEVLPENTVIYGSKCERRVQGEKPFVSESHTS